MGGILFARLSFSSLATLPLGFGAAGCEAAMSAMMCGIKAGRAVWIAQSTDEPILLFLSQGGYGMDQPSGSSSVWGEI